MRISDWSSDVCSSDLFEDGKGVTCNRGEHGAAVWACRGVQCAIVNFGCRRAELRPRVAIDTSQYIPRDQTVDDRGVADRGRLALHPASTSIARGVPEPADAVPGALSTEAGGGG